MLLCRFLNYGNLVENLLWCCLFELFDLFDRRIILSLRRWLRTAPVKYWQLVVVSTPLHFVQRCFTDERSSLLDLSLRTALIRNSHFRRLNLFDWCLCHYFLLGVLLQKHFREVVNILDTIEHYGWVDDYIGRWIIDVLTGSLLCRVRCLASDSLSSLSSCDDALVVWWLWLLFWLSPSRNWTFLAFCRLSKRVPIHLSRFLINVVCHWLLLFEDRLVSYSSFTCVSTHLIKSKN